MNKFTLIPIQEITEGESDIWGISVTDHNPKEEDFFEMPKYTVFKLIEFLTKNSPISFNSPISRPSNKF